jgi:thiamine-monophosphate kinase
MPLLSDIGEDALVTRLIAGLPCEASSVRVAAGDDCAEVLAPLPGQSLLLKTDVLVEDVHFTRAMPPELVGHKALARAISDIGAMGGLPQHGLVTLVLPGDVEVAWLESLYAGLRRCAGAYGVSIVGGETSRGRQLMVNVALTGWVETGRAVLRSGGQVGDAVLVTGWLGGSFASGRHLSFEPRVHEARWLATNAEIHAMMDLSDGLGSDLPRLARASGCEASVEATLLPCHTGCTPEQAWSDGEDYELLLAVPMSSLATLQAAWTARFPHLALSCIGQLVAPGTGSLPAFARQGGWDHFAR